MIRVIVFNFRFVDYAEEMTIACFLRGSAIIGHASLSLFLYVREVSAILKP